MVKSVFAIGPTGSYHFEAPSKWAFQNLPQSLSKTFVVDKEIANVYTLVLGANGSFFITYKGRGNNSIWKFSNGIPAPMKEYLWNGPKLNLTTLVTALGPENGSWFVCDGTHARYNSLPQGLKDGLEKFCWPKGAKSWRSKPRIVQIGVDGNYILITDNHAASWRLGSYPALRDLVQEKSTAKGAGMRVFENIYLNPHAADSFIVHAGNGVTIGQGIPDDAEADFLSIAEAMKSDTDRADNLAVVRAQQQARNDQRLLDVFAACQISQMNTSANAWNNLNNTITAANINSMNWSSW